MSAAMLVWFVFSDFVFPIWLYVFIRYSIGTEMN